MGNKVTHTGNRRGYHCIFHQQPAAYSADGRILRRSETDHTAWLYYLYVGSTNEEQELLADITSELAGVIPVLDLDCDQDSQSFIHHAYQALADIYPSGISMTWVIV